MRACFARPSRSLQFTTYFAATHTQLQRRINLAPFLAKHLRRDVKAHVCLFPFSFRPCALCVRELIVILPACTSDLPEKFTTLPPTYPTRIRSGRGHTPLHSTKFSANIYLCHFRLAFHTHSHTLTLLFDRESKGRVV